MYSVVQTSCELTLSLGSVKIIAFENDQESP
jgi:hypothetical protein